MFDNEMWSWVTLIALGAFHGINPGMGWLFAVALGMQERRSSAVWRALVPLTAGHALAIGAVILLAAFIGVAIPAGTIKWPVGAILIGLGAYRLFRQCHPGYGGMRVGMAGLTAWSFLMASAHGAGLMVLPVFLGMKGTTAHAASSHHAGGAAMSVAGPMTGVLATLAHGAGYLVVTALVAWIVYEKVGLGLLRKAWVNLDLIWAVALIATGGLTFLL